VSGGVIDGGDAAASGGSSVCTDSRPGAGISTATPSQVTCVTCAGGSPPGVFGSPRIDSITVDSTFSGMLNAVFDTLASRAIVSLPAGTYAPAPSTANDECNRADPLNWGDPTGTGVCTNWFPIVRIAGDAVLAAGARGQGVLLVSGRLRVEANALFAGIVVAAGVDVDGSGAEISGAVFAGTAASSVTNGGAIRLVTCVARRASLGVARLEHTPGRWWVELR